MVTFSWKNEYMNIIYLNWGKYELDRKKIIAVIDTTFAVVKRKPEKKKSGLYGIRTCDLCDTGAALYQLS